MLQQLAIPMARQPTGTNTPHSQPAMQAPISTAQASSSCVPQLVGRPQHKMVHDTVWLTSCLPMPGAGLCCEVITMEQPTCHRACCFLGNESHSMATPAAAGHATSPSRAHHPDATAVLISHAMPFMHRCCKDPNLVILRVLHNCLACSWRRPDARHLGVAMPASMAHTCKCGTAGGPAGAHPAGSRPGVCQLLTTALYQW
jgi:hypothetical protein